jgi:probable phosphoglycerate mutase
LYSSPLQRAQRTAKAIGDHHGVAPDIDERLREIDFGDWEGLTGAEISARFPDQWEALATGTDVPLGGTGETLAQVGDRMLAASRAIANGAATAAVTHGGAIRVLLARAIGLSHADRWLLGLAANGSTTSLVFADDRIEIADFNVAAHLEG